MSHSPLMYGLIKLHSRLEGELRSQRKNLGHVRAVIKIIEPNFDLSTIKAKKYYVQNPWFDRGYVFLTALEVLREADKPLSQTEIAKRMLAKRDVVNPKMDELRNVRNAIHLTLERYNGKAVKAVGKRYTRRWSIIGER